MRKLTKQVALGGGEPLLYPDFVRDFSKSCHEHNIICNITTNGTLISKLAECAEDLTMVSLSFDKYKVISLGDYLGKISVAKDFDVLVGSNILLAAYLLADLKKFLRLIDIILNHADFVYLLSPKLYGFLDILQYTDFFYAISILYQGRVFFDEYTRKVLQEQSYDWTTPCQHGKSFVNMNNDGSITGCSFSRKPMLIVDDPSDLLQVERLEFDEFLRCPFIANDNPNSHQPPR